MFNLREYLEDRDIFYRTHGKNVTRGWTNIKCPYCADPSEHLGISPDLGFNCWRCGEKGHISKLITELEGFTWWEHWRADKIIEEFTTYEPTHYAPSVSYLKPIDSLKQGSHAFLPKDATRDFRGGALKYLINRRFDPEIVIPRYDLYCCGPLSAYRHRIIVPVYYNHSIVSFTAIDWTGLASVDKLHCSDSESVIPIKHTIYNIDRVKDFMIICEGVTDVWRLGDGAVATFGTEYSKQQLLKLSKVKAKRVVAVFDADATQKGYELAVTLAGTFPNVRVVALAEGDPADLSNEQAMEYKEQWVST